jgi:hypothetical protein
MNEQGLFGPITEPFNPRNLKKNEAMRYRWGHRDDKKCGDCGEFIGVSGGEKSPNTYFKCKKFGISSGPATDWRKKYIACGLWKERDGSQT